VVQAVLVAVAHQLLLVQIQQVKEITEEQELLVLMVAVAVVALEQ
jgi:hypothetical protein